MNPARAALGSLALAIGCAPAPPHPGPNLLLITIDTLRRDHCSVYGYARDTTPNLRRLAAAGTAFELAYAPTASTAPTHASILTGLYPAAHGVRKNGLPLAESHATLAERLADHGYQTAAVVSSFVLDRRFGTAQGFASYDDAFDPADASAIVERWGGHTLAGGFDRRADATTRRARRWLWEDRDAERPFLLFVHYFDPHSPYEAPPGFARRFDPKRTPRRDVGLAEIVRQYDAEIAFTDHAIGELLDGVSKLGLDGDTLVVVTADHGEGLMDHGHMGHGVHLYEEAVRVPLLVRWSGVLPAGARLDGPVELIDLLPTLLSLAGLPPAPALRGRDLAPALRGEAALDPQRPAFLHRRHYAEAFVDGLRVRGEQFAIRRGDWKYIDGSQQGRSELYDLAGDPGETIDLSRSEPARAERLARQLAAWRQGDAPVPALPDEEREALEALGYVE